MRAATADGPSPNRRLHSEAQSVFPRKVNILVVSLLWDCCCHVAHRTFSGEYGPSGLGYLSSVWAFDGLIPTSLRNARKSFCHRSHTVMPRPPYLAHPDWDGSVHRLSIPRQIVYSVVPWAQWIRLLHPQLVDRPVFKLFHATTFSRLHWHRHSQYVSPHRDGSGLRTVQ